MLRLVVLLYGFVTWPVALSEKLFLTRREEEAFVRKCSGSDRSDILEVAERTRLARESLSSSRILVVEIPEQWTTFGHFVETLVDKRATGLEVAAATNRALFYKNCRYADDEDAVLPTELTKSRDHNLNDCANGYIDFEQYFGLPNRTSTAWPRNGTRLKKIEDPAQIHDDALAITISVWTAMQLATRRLGDKCQVFATTRPVGEAWDNLEGTARAIDQVEEVVGMHLRTGYADHGKEMDDPIDENGNFRKIYQFDVAHPDLLNESHGFPRGTKEWMDLDFAAFSPRRLAGADDILACTPEPLFKLLSLSETIRCLDSRQEKKTGIILATDHTKYFPIMLDQVKNSRLLLPDRIKRKQSSDSIGHSRYATEGGGTPSKSLGTKENPDWHGLGVVGATELHLLSYCDLIVVYGYSFYQRAAEHLAVSDSFTLTTLNMGAPAQSDDPTFQLIDDFCSRGCYSKSACDCARTETEIEYPPQES